MAKDVADLNSGDERAALSNVGARTDAIKKYMHSRFSLEQRIEELTEQHIKPLRDQRKKLNQRTRSDLEMAQTDINIEYARYARARSAQGFEEGGDEVIDNLRELHEALHPGQSLDWVTAIESTQRA